MMLPDELLGGQDISEQEIMLHLALGLFIDHTFTLGRAARIAGMSIPAFLDEIGKRKIPIHYGVQDLEDDLRTVQSLEEKEGGL